MRYRNRRGFLQDLAVLAGVTTPITSLATTYHKKSKPRVGFISGAGLPELDRAFTEQLLKLGYQEGKNILIERRMTRPNSDDLETFTKELVQMDLALIVAAALPFALAIREAKPTMPMVVVTCPGMVSNGFAQSMEHPRGIYTGIEELPPGVTKKRLELLKQAAPLVTHVALLSTTPGRGGHESQLAEAEKTAAVLGVSVKAYRASSLPELQNALTSIVIDGMNGFLNFQGGLSLANHKLIIDIMNEQRIPAIYQATLFANAGGLMTWAPDLPRQFREAAELVDKILKGAKPGDLPVRYPAEYYLTINERAARQIDLTLDATLLSQAHRIIK